VPNTFERITQDPHVLAGRATIRGLRISVSHVVRLLANGMTPAQVVEELPDLDEEDVRQALAFVNTSDVEPLTEQQRDWVVHSEALWREAHSIVDVNPGVDVGDVYHSLRCLELSPSERLARGLTRVRRHPHAG
jgi:uncharacterized protein (DUF433 family)